MRRRLATIGIAMLLAAQGCATDRANAPAGEARVRGPQTYTVSVDAPSPKRKNVQFASFFPGSLKVGPGDTLVFENRSTQAPHTVTFGVEPDFSNAPPQGLPDGAPNPAVVGECYTKAASTKTLADCPNKPGAPPPTYAGKGYWNSGFLVPSVAPQGPNEITMRLSDDIAPGRYIYVCLLHRPMVSSIEVVSEDEQRAAPHEVRADAEAAIEGATQAAAAIPSPKPSSSSGTFEAVAGTGEGAIAVNKFYPQTIDIKSGTKVSWHAHSLFEPHTVTFGSKWSSGADDPAAFAPSGAPSGSDYAGGLANSGFIPPPGRKDKAVFELVFVKPGEYEYVCVLHPGMKGVVRVR